MKFDNIEYLRSGNTRQRKAYSVLSDNQIFSKVRKYDPILVGTIPISIDIESSDLDIICCFEKKEEFKETASANFSSEKGFIIREHHSSDVSAIVVNFVVGDIQIEIFGQAIPTKQQYAYRHMIVEHKLLIKYGEPFKQQIIELKRQGYKTEPAFGLVLGLKGNPYEELLRFETSDEVH